MINGYHSQDPSLQNGNIITVKYTTLAEMGLGSGSIGSDLNPELKQNQEIYRQIINGKFAVDADSSIAGICIDERLQAGGIRSNIPRSAGGPAGAAHSLDTALGSLNKGQNEKSIVESVTEKLAEFESGVCVHGDTHGECGCGAVANSPQIYQAIAEKSQEIAEVLSTLGYAFDSNDIEAIRDKADFRVRQEGFFAERRADILEISQEAGAGYETLEGDHGAMAIVWLTKEGESFDAEKFYKETGKQVFVVHAWAFKETAKRINLTGNEEETKRTELALAIYNLATASVLCHGNMPVLVK